MGQRGGGDGDRAAPGQGGDGRLQPPDGRLQRAQQEVPLHRHVAGLTLVPEVFEWGLAEGDFLFPRFRSLSGKVLVPVKTISMSYSDALADEGRVPAPRAARREDRHSDGGGQGRRGPAFIKGAGGWKSNAMDAYIKSGNAGVQLSDLLLDRL